MIVAVAVTATLWWRGRDQSLVGRRFEVTTTMTKNIELCGDAQGFQANGRSFFVIELKAPATGTVQFDREPRGFYTSTAPIGTFTTDDGTIYDVTSGTRCL